MLGKVALKIALLSYFLRKGMRYVTCALLFSHLGWGLLFL